MVVDSDSCGLVIRCIINITLFCKDGTPRAYFPHEQTFKDIVEKAGTAFSFLLDDIDFEKTLVTLSKQLKNKDVIDAFVYILQKALSEILVQKKRIDDLLRTNTLYRQKIEDLLSIVQAYSISKAPVDVVPLLLNDLKGMLNSLELQYNGDINTVTDLECAEIETLERRICRILYKQYLLEAPEGTKFIAIADIMEEKHQPYFFDSKSKASEWSYDVQNQKYSPRTPWLLNPFSVGAYFEIGADDSPNSPSGDFLCLSDAATAINGAVDIRPHTDVAFVVRARNGGNYFSVQETNAFYANGVLKNVIIDT